MRKTLSLLLYRLFVEVVAGYLVVFPVYAFQVSPRPRATCAL
jgi:hypothetical protein